MITLCPTTYELAQKMPNFSAWVRHQLMSLKVENYEVIKIKEESCPNCEKEGDHYCKPLQMFVRGWKQ